MSKSISAIDNLPLGATVEVFTDGACLGNPGPAAWGFVAVHEGAAIYSASAGIGHGTNITAEMTAAIEALRLLRPRPDLQVTIYSDNDLITKGMNTWLPGWKVKGWRGSKGPVKNRGLWETLDAIASTLPLLKWQWIKGHAGNVFNEMANALAGEAAKRSREVA